MFRIFVLLAVISVALAFTPFGARFVSRTSLRMAEEPKKAHETQIIGDAPYGTPFFQADIGTPSKDTDFGAGDVGGNDYQDSMYSNGPRGKNKPLITDKAVVKLPPMSKIERGYSEAKAAKAYAQANFKKGVAWTDAEDRELLRLADLEAEGTRGRWVRISQALGRSTQDCSLRWNQHLNPVTIETKGYRDIIRDADEDLKLKKEGKQRWNTQEYWQKQQ